MVFFYYVSIQALKGTLGRQAMFSALALSIKNKAKENSVFL